MQNQTIITQEHGFESNFSVENTVFFTLNKLGFPLINLRKVKKL